MGDSMIQLTDQYEDFFPLKFLIFLVPGGLSWEIMRRN